MANNWRQQTEHKLTVYILKGFGPTVRYTDILPPTCTAPRNRIDSDNLEIDPERRWAKQQLC